MNELNGLAVICIILSSFLVGMFVGMDFELPKKQLDINFSDVPVEDSWNGFTYIRNGEPLFIVLKVYGRTPTQVLNSLFHEFAHVFNRWEAEHFFKWDFNSTEVKEC